MTLQIFLACISPKRPRPGGEVLGKGEDRPAVHLAEAGDDAVRRDLDLLHAEVDRAVGDEHIGFLEGPGVEKEVQALPGGELAAGVLLLHRLGPTHALDLRLPLPQLLDLLCHCLHRRLLFHLTRCPRNFYEVRMISQDNKWCLREDTSD